MKNGIIAILAILLIVGCNLEQKVSQFEGDGTIEFVKRPGLLGSDGVFLKFDTFNISSNFNRTYSLNKLPSLDNSYSLYLTVESPDPLDALKPCIIVSQLVGSKGTTLWDVNEKIESWRCAETSGSKSVDYYYLTFGEHPKDCSFGPVEGEPYKLTVSFQTSAACKNVNTKAYFRLKAGGFK